jgi:hypothetical protein
LPGVKEQMTREPYPLAKLDMGESMNFEEGIDEFLSSCSVEIMSLTRLLKCRYQISMSLNKMRKEYYDTPKNEIYQAVFENTVYGFLGSIIVVFISQQIDIAVLIGYISYYFFLGRVVNRPKYVTSLGKFIVFPIPTAMGAFIGYKFAGLITTML